MLPRYSSIRAPVGLLFGRDDPILDPHEQGERLREEIPSLELELIQGGHMLPVTQPDAVAAFIARMAAKAPPATEKERTVGGI